MIDPKPVDSFIRSKPSKILSKENLFQTWDSSRDSTSRAGSPGIDNETAKNFASNLDANLDEIRKRLLAGTFGFSRLRPVFIRKPNSNKERVICVPTVRDRLVQRTIIQYLDSSKKLPVYHASSYGFIKGQGTAKAINKAVEHRSLYEWCVGLGIGDALGLQPDAPEVRRRQIDRLVSSCHAHSSNNRRSPALQSQLHFWHGSWNETRTYLSVQSMPSATYTLFRNAILGERQVVCVYEGRPRELCPHIIGTNMSGEEVVLAWQFAGESSGKLPQWRCLRLANVRDARARDGRWYAGGSHKTTQKCVADIDLDINIHVRKLR